MSEAEAIESLHRQGKLAEQPLLRELLTEEPGGRGEEKTDDILDAKRARETILAHLAFRLCLTSQQVTRELIAVEHLESLEFETVHGRVKDVAQGMHSEGFLHATAVNDGLYLQLMDRPQPS